MESVPYGTFKRGGDVNQGDACRRIESSTLREDVVGESQHVESGTPLSMKRGSWYLQRKVVAKVVGVFLVMGLGFVVAMYGISVGQRWVPTTQGQYITSVKGVVENNGNDAHHNSQGQKRSEDSLLRSRRSGPPPTDLENPLHGDKSDSGQPHVVVVLVDDMGFNDVGWSGDDFSGLTPNIERLKSMGVELTSYYTQQLCTPARAAILTGRYPFKTGTQYEVIQPTEPWGLPLKYNIMPRYFKDMGYGTHAIGKWHLGHGYRDLLPQMRGFDTYYGFLTDQSHYDSHKNPQYDILDFMEADKGGYSCVIGENGNYSTDLHTDRAISIIRDHSPGGYLENSPMMLYLAYQSPHYPLETDESIDYVEDGIMDILDSIHDTDRKKVGMMVWGLDKEIGRLLDELDQSGMMSNSIIAFASDNGGCPLHGNSNYPLRGTKHYLWEGGSRARAIFFSSNLSKTRRGAQYDGLFHVTDWLPTILEGVVDSRREQNEHGVSKAWEADKEELDGVSQLKALLDTEGVVEDPRLEVLYNIMMEEDTETGLNTIRGALRVGDWKFISDEYCQVWLDISGRYEHTEYLEACNSMGGSVDSCGVASNRYIAGDYLFNVKDDPYEFVDLYDAHPEIVEQLSSRLSDLASEGIKRVWEGGRPVLSTSRWANFGCISPFRIRGGGDGIRIIDNSA